MMDGPAAGDFRVRVTVRNARLLRAIEAKGYKPGKRLAEACGVSYKALYELVSFRQSPALADGSIRPAAQALSDFLQVDVTELFPESLQLKLETNTSEKDIDAEAIFALMHADDRSIPALEHARDVQTIVAGLLHHADLSPREVLLIEQRHGLRDGHEKTLDDVSAMMGLSRERVRQLETRAFRKMRRAISEKGIEYDGR